MCSMTATQVKICGLKTQAALEAALAGGADYVGLVFFAPSPRNVSPAVARDLAERARGHAKIVALMVDPDDGLIERVVAAADPDFFQLHGEETPDRVREIRRRWGRRVIKAVKVKSAGDAEAAEGYGGAADLILFDARPPEGSDRPGGHGARFDWGILRIMEDGAPFMLSGGLTPENVAEAIRATGAAIVDVSSGVESGPGEKDPDRIRRFLKAAKGAKQGA
jgi:phosphoribosylanthranilate isomerase